MIEVREVTRKAEIFPRSEIRSSVMPSLKYSCIGSPDRFSSGRTANECIGVALTPTGVRNKCVFEMLPAREYPCDEPALEEFRRAFRMRFEVDTRNVTLYQDLRAGVHPQGLEQYLPLFYDKTSLLLDYLDHAPRLLLQPGVFEAAESHMRRIAERWEQRRHDIERPVLDPWELYFTPEDLKKRLQECDTTHLPDPELKPSGTAAFASMPAPDLHIHERGKEAAADLLAFLDGFEGRIVFAADTPGRRELLRTTLAAFGVRPEPFESFAGFSRNSSRLGLAVLPVDEGFMVPGELSLLAESQLFGGRTRTKVQRAVYHRTPVHKEKLMVAS